MRKFSSIVIIACVLSICCVCYAQEDIEPEGRFNYTCDCKVTDGITGVPAIYKGVASFSEDHFFMMSVEIPGYLVI